MANKIHTYVRQDTTPDDSRDNLKDRGQRNRELESFVHNTDQPENTFNNDSRENPEQTDLQYGQTLRENYHEDLSGDAAKSSPVRPRTYTFGRGRRGGKGRSKGGRGRGHSRGIENGRER